ncbi:MAG: hypothetical protein FWC84_00910, partial [Alphaproteobacteria bacterium]|nr:hypothetical protein [Alphaproteobacteria bacterium]
MKRMPSTTVCTRLKSECRAACSASFLNGIYGPKRIHAIYRLFNAFFYRDRVARLVRALGVTDGTHILDLGGIIQPVANPAVSECDHAQYS